MLRTVKAATLTMALVAATGAYQVVARANGAGMPAPSAAPAGRTMSPEEMATAAYNSGIDHRDKGVKAEQQAASQTKDADRTKAEKKASDEFEKALKDFKKAADLNATMPQAFNGMGYSYRKLGDYAKALENYDRALQLNPTFPDAIEYRAEAYLGLNRLDDAKQAYLKLFAMDRKQADDLMKSMSAYVVKKKANPAGVDPAALAAFEAWIGERGTVAEQTKQMALNVVHGPWR